MNTILLRFQQSVGYLSRYPKIGKFLSSFFGLIEVPLLEAFHFIDKYLVKGSYQQLMKYFSLFYGSKIIPLNVKIERGIPTIAPTEEILNIVRRVPAVSIGYCYCRAKYKNCDNPVWTCIHIGTAKHIEELGKKIPLKSSSIDEVEKLLIKTDELGLVHQLLTAPSPDYVYVICNCCPCCCVMLKNAIKYRLHGAAMPSNFITELDRGRCTNCGICVEKCHFSALTMNDGRLEYSEESCVGCGLCTNACPERALSLKRREKK